MTRSELLERIRWELRMFVGGIGMIIASPLILVGMIIALREEERDLRLLAEDAGMTVDEYIRAEHARIDGYYHGNV